MFNKAKVVMSMGGDYGLSLSMSETKHFKRIYKSTNIKEYRPVVAAGLFIGHLCATYGDFAVAERMFGEHLEQKVFDLRKFLKITEEEADLILANKRDCESAVDAAKRAYAG